MEAPLNAREVERKGRMPGKGKEQREGEIKIGGNRVQKQRDQIKKKGRRGQQKMIWEEREELEEFRYSA